MAAQSTILALCLAAVAARQTPAALRPAALRVRGGSTAAEENANARIEKLRRLGEDAGFVAALDQSGGSTPKALADYGVEPSAYDGDEAMYDAVHAMRERIVKSPAFDDRVLAAILFEKTMDRTFGGLPAPEYLWATKRCVPLLKCDKGLESEVDGCQLMKDTPDLEALLERAKKLGVAGTKMRSRIAAANEAGIQAVVAQQFAMAKRILKCGLCPIVEPEIDIRCPDKALAEEMLLNALHEALHALGDNEVVMLKLTLPECDGLYSSCVMHPKVLRVLALSGGYDRAEATHKLARNPGVIGSFSRALMEGASQSMSDADFDAHLETAVATIRDASVNKVEED
jgi:fructose-bisphosphate aldolase class I